MNSRSGSFDSETLDSDLVLEQPEDFLSPEQRMKAVAKVLADIALDAIRKNHDLTPPPV
jgi:hypothetical protein